MNNANNEKTTSRHAATDPEKCFEQDSRQLLEVVKERSHPHLQD